MEQEMNVQELTPEFSIARQFIDKLENVLIYDAALANRMTVLPVKIATTDDAPMDVFRVACVVYSTDMQNILRNYDFFVRMDDYGNLQLYDEQNSVYRNFDSESLLFYLWRKEMAQACHVYN